MRNDQREGETSPMNDTINRQILLVEKPTGKLGPEHFRLTNATIPAPKEG